MSSGATGRAVAAEDAEGVGEPGGYGGEDVDVRDIYVPEDGEESSDGDDHDGELRPAGYSSELIRL